MEWWTHLWLNEGYASFVEFLCVNHLFPNYDIWNQFVNDMYIKALELDSLQNSHAIEVPVGHPSEIDEIFDDISYNKGASVIRMLHYYIGDDDFRKGMNLYLTRHQYKNTFTEDLWAALEESSKKPIGAVMSTWTKQMGFPLITVSSKPQGDGLVLNLKQNRFVLDPSKPYEDYLWMVPISVSTSQSPSKSSALTVLEKREGELTVPFVGPNDWIKLNPGLKGYYRTKYPPEMLDKFVPAIQDKSMPPLDRLGLVDDLFAIVQAGHTSTVEVLKLLKAFEYETDFNVWSSVCNILSRLNSLLSHTDYHNDFVDYQKRLLAKIYDRLGWDTQPNETHLNVMLRAIILHRMAVIGDENVALEAKKRFDQHIGDGPVLHADLRTACYKATLKKHPETFDTLLKMYRDADLQEEKDRISRGLSATTDPALLRRVLDFAMSVGS